MDDCKKPSQKQNTQRQQQIIAPYSASYLHRLNRILKQRQEQEKIKSSDVCSTRSSGSLRTFTGDVAKLHISEKEFGIPSRVTRPDEVPRFCFSNSDVMRIYESANRSKTTSQRARSADKSKKRLSIHGNLESVSMYVIDSETTLNMSKALQSAEKKVIERNSLITPWISCVNGTRSKHRVVNSKVNEKEKFDIAIRSAPSYKLGKWIRKSPSKSQSKSLPSSPSNANNMNYIPFSQVDDKSSYFDPTLLKSPIKLNTTSSDYAPETNEITNENRTDDITATSEINKLYVSVVESKVSPEATIDPKPENVHISSVTDPRQSVKQHIRWLPVSLYDIPYGTKLLSDSMKRNGHYEVALSSALSVGEIVKTVTEKHDIRESIEAIMIDSVVYNISSTSDIETVVGITDASTINIYCINSVDGGNSESEKKPNKRNKKGKRK